MAREFRGKIPRVPIDADTSKADQKIERLFQKIKNVEHIKIDADVSQAQRRLETLVKRNNSQMSSTLINNALKDFKMVLGAMKTEFENNGMTSIFGNLERTCDMVESRFANLNVSIGSKQFSGLEKILNNFSGLEAITDFSFDSIVSSQDVQNSEEILNNIKAAKKEIKTIGNQVDYVIRTLNKNTNTSLSEDKLQKYKDKIEKLQEVLSGFSEIDDPVLQNSLFNAIAKTDEAMSQINSSLTKVKDNAIEAQKEVVKANKEIDKSQEKTTQTAIRTVEQVNAELEKEKQKLKEVEKQQDRNTAAFEKLARMRADYGGERLGSDKAVYDTDKINGAVKALEEFNAELEKRNQFQEKYSQLCQIYENFFAGQYGINGSMHKDVNDFIKLVPEMRSLSLLFDNGIKGVPTKEINKYFKSVVNQLKSDLRMIVHGLSSGEIIGAPVNRDLDEEENRLGQEQQRLFDERQAQLTKINALRQEELDLIQQAGQEEIKNTQITKTKSRYYEIDEKAAKLSKQMRSFDDYKAGSATASYRSAVDEIAKIVEEKKAQFPDQSDKLDKLFDRFARNLATFINRDNQIGAQYPSVMISGAGNYNTKKHNRQMASWGKNYQYYDEKVLPIESRIRNFGSTGTIAIRNDESDALEKREAKLEYMKYWHEIMVEVNKYYRKNKTLEGFEGVGPDELERIKKDFATIKQVGMYDVPYPQYALRNDNQNIKRIEGSVAELKRLKENKGLQENNDIYKLWTDKQDMRIRISFEIGKPDQEIIDMLKGKSFKWSPKNNAWQRQLTDNAVYDTKRLQEALHEFYGITSVSDTQSNIPAMKQLQAQLTGAQKKLNTTSQQKTDISKRLNELKAIIKNQEDWIKYLDRVLNEDNFKTSGKRQATDQLRSLTKTLIARRQSNYSNVVGEYAQEMTEVAWVRGYQEAQRQGVAQSTLVRFSTDAGQSYDRNLETLQDAYALHTKILNERQLELSVLENQGKATQDNLITMKQLQGLMADLKNKYGGESFNNIFGEIIGQFGELNASNATELYDALIAKNEEYQKSVEEQAQKSQVAAKEIEAFLSQNQELASQYSTNLEFMNKYSELMNQMSQSTLTAADATMQLNEFVQTFEQQGQLKFADGTLLDETQVKAVEKYCSILKKKMGEAYNEARYLKAALDLVFDIKQGNVDKLMDRFVNVNSASNAALKILTGMPVNNQNNRDAALRSINPDAYDKIIAEQKAAAEKAKAELAAQKSDFQIQWEEFVSAMIGGNAFEGETNLVKGKILNAFSEYEETAVEALDKINKAWLQGEFEGKKAKNSYIQQYITSLDTQKEYYDELRNSKAGDFDTESLFDFSGTKGLTEEKAQALRDEAAAYDEMIAKKKEYYGIVSNPQSETQLFEQPSGQLSFFDGITESAEKASKSTKKLAETVKKAKTDISSPTEQLSLFDEQLSEDKVVQLAEKIESENAKLTSSYKGLADAVERYVEASKKLWVAYDKGEDFSKFAEERNAVIEDIVSLFPTDDTFGIPATSLQSGYRTRLQSKEMSSEFAKYGAESALKAIETDLNQAAEEVRLAEEKKRIEQERLAEEAKAKQIAAEMAESKRKQAEAGKQSTEQTNAQAEAESQLGAAIEANTQKKQEQAKAASEVTKQTEQQIDAEKAIGKAAEKANKSKNDKLKGKKRKKKDTGDANDTEGEIARIVQKDTNTALKLLRDAKNSKSPVIDLSGIYDVGQLEKEFSKAAQNAATKDGYEVVTARIRDNVAMVKIYNNALETAITQEYRMQDALDGTSAELQHVRDAYQFNIKKLTDKSKEFDKDFEQRFAQAQINNLIASLKGHEYSGKANLESLAGNIVDEESLKKFNAELKIAKVDVATLSKQISHEMNTFESMSKKMDNASERIAHLRNEIKAFSGIEGIGKLKKHIGEMWSASDDYKKNTKDLNEQAKAYERYKKAEQAYNADKVLVQDRKKEINAISQLDSKMRDASTEIDTMRLKLDGLGNVNGITKAKAMLDAMTAAVKEYNAAQDKRSQKKAYNEYNNLKSSFDSHLKYINEAKKQQAEVDKAWKDKFQNNYKYTGGKTADDQTILNSMSDFYKQQEEKANQFNNNIKSIYDRLVATVKEINSLDTKMNSLTFQDKGSGLYGKTISSLQSRKSELVADLRSLTDEINNALSLNPASAESGLSQFFKDERVQAALTSEEIQKFNNLLRESDEIKFNFGAKFTAQIQPIIEKIASLKQMIADGFIAKNSDITKNVLSIDTTLSSKLKNFTENPTAFGAVNIMKYVKDISTYIETLDRASQAEQKYFSGRQKYTAGQTAGSYEDYIKGQVQSITEAQKQLEAKAKTFAKDSGFGDAFITKFIQGADGISKLDFSVFDTATNSLRNFRIEMGSVSDGMYITETTVNKTLSNIQAVDTQMQSMSNLIVKLGQFGADINIDTATGKVLELLQLLEDLKRVTKGDITDQNIIQTLLDKSKLTTSEVEKLYKQMLKMDGAINNKSVSNFGKVDLKADMYTQATNAIKEFASTFPNSTLQIGRFNEATGKLPFTITNASGAMKSFEVEISSVNGQMVLQEKGVKQLGSAWSQLKSSVSSIGRQFLTAIVGYNVFFKVISTIKQGIGYVKEIDLAMTELKKVTDESEASYNNFLQTASKTAGTIGSTVSDFTDATANFARLGYSMDEAAEMGKTAIVYKNVADGLDTVEESTNSIISTMKAFGIESSDTMGIIDRFNEVGNNFAITSAGIGEALQRSAAALSEAGNSLDESIGLITAANSVIQNPEQVGTALKTKFCLYVQKCA